MWIAQIAPGYVSRKEAFDDEAAALRWLEREMRAVGTKHGVCYEIGDEDE